MIQRILHINFKESGKLDLNNCYKIPIDVLYNQKHIV